MGNEIELKYSIPSADLAEKILSSQLITAELSAPIRIIEMSSTYYDTPAADLLNARISLRRRTENDEVIYTVKTPKASEGALSTRGEWQVNADNIDDALKKLADLGAPEELFNLIKDNTLIPCAEVSFTRRTAPLKLGAELCVDTGTFGEVPFAELELELSDGKLEEMSAFSGLCAKEFSLTAEPRSKFTRARAVFSADFK